jgi:pimeloyl-ACP methyl ester carboxylesterase
MTDKKTPPTLVLLPGMDGTGDLFSPLVATLGNQYPTRVVRYPNASVGYAALTAVARRWLPTQTPFVLLGESFSGPIAISLAALQPPNLRGLILCGSFARNPRPWLLSLLYPLLSVPLDLMVPTALANYLLLGRHATKHLRSMLFSATTQVGARTLQARVRAVRSVDVCAKLAAVRVPLLYLLAEQDRLVPQSALQTLLQRRPDMRVIAVSAPHMLLQAAPRTAANAIIAFLHEVRKARLQSVNEEI